MTQEVGEAANDRETESHTAVRPLGCDVVSHLIELLEDARLMLGPDADPGVDDFDRDARTAPSRTDNDPSAPRVAHRVGDEVLEDPRVQRRIGVDRETRRHDRQRKTASGRLRRELGADPCKQRPQCNALPLGPQRARFQTR